MYRVDPLIINKKKDRTKKLQPMKIWWIRFLREPIHIITPITAQQHQHEHDRVYRDSRHGILYSQPICWPLGRCFLLLTSWYYTHWRRGNIRVQQPHNTPIAIVQRKEKQQQKITQSITVRGCRGVVTISSDIGSSVSNYSVLRCVRIDQCFPKAFFRHPLFFALSTITLRTDNCKLFCVCWFCLRARWPKVSLLCRC